MFYYNLVLVFFSEEIYRKQHAKKMRNRGKVVFYYAFVKIKIIASRKISKI